LYPFTISSIFVLKKEYFMATWKTVQDSIKRSMKELGELYEVQNKEKKELQEQISSQVQENDQGSYGQLTKAKEEIARLQRKVEELTKTLRQRDAYILDLEESSQIGEELDDTFTMRLGESPSGDSEAEALRKVLAEAERVAEEQRLAEEAKRILDVQKQREREYQDRLLAEEQKREENERRRRAQKENEDRLHREEQAEQQQKRQKEHARQQVVDLERLEQSYAEVSAQLGLVQKRVHSNPRLLELNERFEQARTQVEKRRSSVEGEYSQAKNTIEKRHKLELDVLAGAEVSSPSSSGLQKGVAAHIENHQTEITLLEKKISEIETQLNGFFVRNRTRLEQERDQHVKQVDELRTSIVVLQHKKVPVETTDDSSHRLDEKRAEISTQKEMFERQWKQRLEALEQEIEKEIGSLESQREREQQSIEKSVHTEISRLMKKKDEIESEIERMS
jgi:hypothetical protein